MFWVLHSVVLNWLLALHSARITPSYIWGTLYSAGYPTRVGCVQCKCLNPHTVSDPWVLFYWISENACFCCGLVVTSKCGFEWFKSVVFNPWTTKWHWSMNWPSKFTWSWWLFAEINYLRINSSLNFNLIFKKCVCVYIFGGRWLRYACKSCEMTEFYDLITPFFLKCHKFCLLYLASGF